jgi:hypothetical protein
MFSGSQQSTEDDFRDVEFNGDVDDALGGTGQLNREGVKAAQ